MNRSINPLGHLGGRLLLQHGTASAVCGIQSTGGEISRNSCRTVPGQAEIGDQYDRIGPMVTPKLDGDLTIGTDRIEEFVSRADFANASDFFKKAGC